MRPVSDRQQRPFIVHTDDGSVLARSTAFSVRKLAQQTRVGVLEASVEVRPCATLIECCNCTLASK